MQNVQFYERMSEVTITLNTGERTCTTLLNSEELCIIKKKIKKEKKRNKTQSKRNFNYETSVDALQIVQQINSHLG